MAKEETNIKNIIRVEASKRGMVTFNNPVGLAWAGKVNTSIKIKGGIALMSPYPISYGLTVGSGDLVGWEEVIITPDMVGQKMARFLSIEVKTKTGKLRKGIKGQDVWHDNVTKAGGKSIIARSPDDLY